MRNSARLTAVMDGAEQRALNDVTLAGLSTVCVCVREFCRVGGYLCVYSFPLSQLPIPWTQWEWVEQNAVCELCACRD